jgi:hypothetical protein
MKDFDALMAAQKAYADTTAFANSDIAGFFYIANHEFGKYINRPVVKNVCIISDLEQNCAGFFNLVNTKFCSAKKIAQGDPDSDFLSISTGLRTSNLKNINVMYFKGDIPDNPANDQVQNKMMKYWNRLFSNFGMIVNMR